MRDHGGIHAILSAMPLRDPHGNLEDTELMNHPLQQALKQPLKLRILRLRTLRLRNRHDR